MVAEEVRLLKRQRPRVIDVGDEISMWVHTGEELVYVDTVGQPLIDADQAERAAKWLLKYAHWKRKLLTAKQLTAMVTNKGE